MRPFLETAYAGGLDRPGRAEIRARVQVSPRPSRVKIGTALVAQLCWRGLSLTDSRARELRAHDGARTEFPRISPQPEKRTHGSHKTRYRRTGALLRRQRPAPERLDRRRNLSRPFMDRTNAYGRPADQPRRRSTSAHE